MRVSLPLLASVLWLSGCREAKIDNYQVPSERPEPLPPVLTGATGTASPPAAADAAMASTAVPTASGPALTWTAPAHWKAKPPTAMRKGSYAVPGAEGTEADFSVTAFPGNVGGEAANFNRWRGQIGLPPLPDAEVTAAVTRFEQNGLQFAVVEFVNEASQPAQRMLGGIVPLGNATWFFKLAGPDALVAREKPAYLELLRSVKTSDPATR